MSPAYTSSVLLAANLTPTGRSGLLVVLAKMIEADQGNTLQLLSHSVKVSQHFASVAEQRPSTAE